MLLVKRLYEKVKGKPAPYYYNYSILTIMVKPIRKFIAQVLAPYCPFNWGRILLYRICGFKIGKHCFIGMRANIISKTPEGNGLTIGENSVIGACTFVNKNIPAGATAVSVPC